MRAHFPLDAAPRSAALAGVTVVLAIACTSHEEPRPSPIVARRLGGDSLAPGSMVVRCRPEDAGCVPSYAVACPAPPAADSGPAPRPGPPLSDREEAWCLAHAPDSAAPTRR